MQLNWFQINSPNENNQKSSRKKKLLVMDDKLLLFFEFWKRKKKKGWRKIQINYRNVILQFEKCQVLHFCRYKRKIKIEPSSLMQNLFPECFQQNIHSVFAEFILWRMSRIYTGWFKTPTPPARGIILVNF